MKKRNHSNLMIVALAFEGSCGGMKAETIFKYTRIVLFLYMIVYGFLQGYTEVGQSIVLRTSFPVAFFLMFVVSAFEYRSRIEKYSKTVLPVLFILCASVTIIMLAAIYNSASIDYRIGLALIILYAVIVLVGSFWMDNQKEL